MAQDLLQPFAVAPLARQMPGNGEAGVVAQVALLQLARLAHADQAGDVLLKMALPGAIQRHGRLRIGPGAVEQQRQPVVKQVGKGSEAVVLLVIDALARVLGQVNRQRPVRAKQPEAVDRHLMQRAAVARRNAGNGRGSKRQRGQLADAQRFMARQRRTPQRITLTALCIDAPQQLEQVVTPGRSLQRGPEVGGQALQAMNFCSLRGHISVLLPMRGAQ
ncbi:Uncharacterised protein [Klebsiella pneumoniae]|nr:Uncharacterised protein [Klebsiella pneumoniae]